MPDKYHGLEHVGKPVLRVLAGVLKKRDALHERFAQQHRTIHHDRNVKAGDIYENTKAFEDAARQLLDEAERAEYAPEWMTRWPR